MTFDRSYIIIYHCCFSNQLFNTQWISRSLAGLGVLAGLEISTGYTGRGVVVLTEKGLYVFSYYSPERNYIVLPSPEMYDLSMWPS